MLELNKIYCGDCLELMKDIDDKSIDLVLTDPPYLFVKGGMSSKKFNVGKNSRDSYMVTEMSDFGKDSIYSFLNAIKTKLKKMNSFIFCSKLQIPYYLNWAIDNKYKFDVGIYDKMNGAIKSKIFLKPCDYYIRIYEIGLKRNENNILYEKVKRYKMPTEKIHEAGKPIGLIEEFVLLGSSEGDTVLDCFNGSGTTCLAAKNLKRNFIGIEKEQKYVDIANKRLETTTVSLF